MTLINLKVNLDIPIRSKQQQWKEERLVVWNWQRRPRPFFVLSLKYYIIYSNKLQKYINPVRLIFVFSMW